MTVTYSLGIASRIAVACDCLRRGDLDGAASVLAQAARLARAEGAGTDVPPVAARTEVRP